jgi:hypothetical protein
VAVKPSAILAARARMRMSALSAKIKKTLADLEVVTKSLLSLDADDA